MPTEDQSKKATIRAQKTIIQGIVATRLPVPEGEAKRMIAQIDGVLKGPYFVEENHPPFNMFSWPFFPHQQIALATASLNDKRVELESLLAKYEFDKEQAAVVESSPARGVATIAIFSVAALLLALGIRKFR